MGDEVENLKIKNNPKGHKTSFAKANTLSRKQSVIQNSARWKGLDSSYSFILKLLGRFFLEHWFYSSSSSYSVFNWNFQLLSLPLAQVLVFLLLVLLSIPFSFQRFSSCSYEVLSFESWSLLMVLPHILSVH